MRNAANTFVAKPNMIFRRVSAAGLCALMLATMGQQATAAQFPLREVSPGGSATLQLRNSIELAKAQDLTVVTLGGEVFERELSSRATTTVPLDTSGTRQVVMVRSGTQDKQLIMQLLARGNIVVSVGLAKVDAARSAFAMLMDINDGGRLKMPEADYDENQPRLSVTMQTGEVAEGLVSAYFYSPNGARSFHSTEQNEVVAAAEAVQWARDLVINGELDASTNRSKAGDFTLAYTRDHTHVCYYNNYPSIGPIKAGKMNIRTSYSKQAADGSSSYDLWAVKYTTQMLPDNTHPNFELNDWRNADLYIETDIDKNVDSWKLLDYEPTTTQGQSTVGVNLNGGAGGVSGSTSWSYTVSDIVVQDQGDFSREFARWWHNIDETKAVGTRTLKIQPGALIRVGNNTSSPWSKLYEAYHGVWRNYNYPYFDDEFAHCIANWH